MMGAKHTPGPWSYTLGYVMRITAGDGLAVAGVHRIGKHTGNGGPEVWAANARLLAAAPDLLEACKALLPEGWGDDDIMDHIPGVRLARLAIAKAEGRS